MISYLAFLLLLQIITLAAIGFIALGSTFRLKLVGLSLFIVFTFSWFAGAIALQITEGQVIISLFVLGVWIIAGSFAAGAIAKRRTPEN
jgi:hypothetical protein